MCDMNYLRTCVMTSWYVGRDSLQDGEDASNAIRCTSLFAKELRIMGFFGEKRPICDMTLPYTGRDSLQGGEDV